MSAHRQTRQHSATDVVDCTCANLRKAARVVTQAYDAALQPAGLKATQFTLLAALTKLGDAPLTRLADALVMDRTTLTRNLKPLVRDGFVRVDQEEDQRIRMVSLTDAGRDVFDKARPRWEQAQSKILGTLGQARWSGLLDSLSETVAVVRDQ